MNPTSNKKDFDDLSIALKDLAYSYIEKYSPSKQQLKVHLMKKVLFKFKSTKSKKEISGLIDKIIVNLEQNKFLNDELYSDSKSRSLLRRGYSLNKINQSLRMKGIDQKYIQLSLDKIKNKEIEPDFVSALKLCKRRRIGAIRPNANRELFYKKDMGVLARAGFGYELSKRVLTLEQEEFQKLIKII
ncbi:RecX family transcriptional regulator [Pelagibacteraceae bacterium]|nr:RecX family transcriptional regulator [Pelagibacteraceae bacterium]